MLTQILFMILLGAGDPNEWKSAKVEYATFKDALGKWKLFVPDEKRGRLIDGFTLGRDRHRFETKPHFARWKIDADRDGKFDDLEGPVELEVKTENGQPFRYAIRPVGEHWSSGGDEWVSAGGWKGNINRQPILLVDRDLDGQWGEMGEDAIVSGRGKKQVTTILTPVIRIRDELVEILVTQDPLAIQYRPYTGPTGEIDLDAGLSGVKGATVVSLVIIDRAGQCSVDVAKSQGPVAVPPGEYRISEGVLQRRSGRKVATLEFSGARSEQPETIRILGKKMKPFAVEAGERCSPNWGAPFDSYATFFADEDYVTMTSYEITVVGSMGETYDGLIWSGRP